MDYSKFIKKFELPLEFKPPQKLVFEDLIARPLTKNDLEDDLKAVNSSVEVIRKTRGGSWPEGPLDKTFDFLDLAWHEREFRDNTSFAYVIYNTKGEYAGCFYLYPMGVRTELTEQILRYDVDTSWWVTAESYKHGYYEKTYRALQQWLTEGFPFEKVYYSNKEIPV
jgi:GNAT acetyltransferase-like protein